MKILFTSTRPLDRAENLLAVFSACTLPKDFHQMSVWRKCPALTSGNYSLIVADEVPAESSAPVLCITHGIPGGKLYGLDQKYPYVKEHEVKNLVAVIGCSSFTYHLVTSAFGVSPEKVHNIGMPRTDIYFQRKKESTGRVYFYAPTYRTLEEYYDFNIDWRYISDNLEEDETLVVKPHMMDTGSIVDKHYPNIVEIPSRFPSTPILMESDVIISDFSSIIFDGYVMRIPAILFAKDTEHYLKERGMYYPYPEGYSGRYCTNELLLLQLMHRAKWSDQDEHYRRIFCENCDGHATERVLELINELVL